jgi:PKD repeat protein
MNSTGQVSVRTMTWMSLLLVLTLFGTVLNPASPPAIASQPVAHATINPFDTGSPPPYPSTCGAGSFPGVSIETAFYNVWDFDPTTNFQCAASAGPLSESAQIVKPGQQITFTDTDPNPLWGEEPPHDVITSEYIQLKRLVGVEGALGGNIDGCGPNGNCSPADGYTGWADVVSGCGSGNSTCTVQIADNPMNGGPDAGNQVPAFRANEWYTIGQMASNCTTTFDGCYHEVAFFLADGNPAAQFTYNATKTPGQFQFLDQSTPGYLDTITTWRWDFGDGQTSASQNPEHTFTKPGTYNVTLTVTNNEGKTNSASQSITIPAPTLSVSLSYPGSGKAGVPQVNPGDTFAAVLTVAASSGLGDLSNITFAGQPLNISPAGAVSVVSGPSPRITGALTLAPDTQKQYTYTLKANQLGTVTLSSQANGLDAAGSTVAANTNSQFTIGHVLQVLVSATPNKLQLANADDGSEIAKPVSVTVTVTNTGTKKLQNVKLTDVEGVRGETADFNIPIICATKPAPKSGNCALTASGSPDPGSKIGTLAAGQSKQVKYTFSGQYDGNGEIDATASCDNPDASGQSLQGFGSVIVPVSPTLMVMLDMNGGHGQIGPVTSGNSLDMGGYVKNLTNSYQIDLDPMDPTLTGNIGLANPTDPNNPPPSDSYPVSISPSLKPQDLQQFDSQLATVVSAGTRGTVAYDLTGSVTPPGAQPAALDPSQVTSDVPDATVNLSVNDSVPDKQGPGGLSTGIAMFTQGFLKGSGQWFLSTYDTVAWALKSTPKAILTLALCPLILMQTVDYYLTYWAYLTPDARSEWYTEIATGILAQTQKLGKTLPEVKAKVEAAISGWIVKLGNSWGEGDWSDVAEQLGEVSGNVALEAASWSIHLPEAAKLVKLGDAVKESGIAKRISAGLKALQAGDDLTNAGNALSKLYGLTISQVEALQLLAKEKGLLVGIRSRNPLSTKWEELGALLKPEAIKIKTVDEIDTAFLGYRKVDEASVVFKKPITSEQLHASTAYQEASKVEQKAADIRLSKRQAEWEKYEAQYKQMAKPIDQGGGVDVAFDYKANGSAVPPSTTVATPRNFALDPVKGYGQDYYVVKMGDNRGILRRITGDVDMVAVTKADGKILSAAERLDIYQNLQDIIDIQHGDTFGWLQDGELVGKAKADLLKDHLPGGEPLAVFDPTGAVRANFIQPKMTFFNTVDQQGRIWYVGGYRTPLSTAYHVGQLAYPMFTTVDAARPWLTPLGWGRQILQPGSGSQSRTAGRPAGTSTSTKLGKTCRWQYVNGKHAGLAYPNGSGGLEYWKGKKWANLTIKSCWERKGSDVGPLRHHLLNLLPQSSVQTTTLTGSASLAINGTADADPGLKIATKQWFARKQKVIIDPGAKGQETAKIKSIALGPHTDTITFAKPLKHQHVGGELISVLP